MAPHSSILAWKMPWALEPGRPWCQKESDMTEYLELREASNFLFKPPTPTVCTCWRRKWQPTPVYLPEESQARGSLVGCRLWGRTESDTSEVT